MNEFPRRIANDHGSDGYRRLVLMCAFLPVVSRQSHVLLPRTKLAKLLNVEPKTVGVWVKWAVRDGYLKCANKYAPNSHKAWEYSVAPWMVEWAGEQ